MVTIALYARQKKRHRCTEQTFGLCGRKRGWDVLREQHWNKYTIKGETDHQPRLDAWDKCSGLVHWEDPERLGGGGRWEGASGWGTHVNPWLIHTNVWQKPLQYCKVISFQLIKINGKKKKKCFLLGRKAMTNQDSILKSRDITLPTKVCLVKAMVFPAAMYGCESWTIEKQERWRTDAFELWCWRRLLRVPWTARK